MGVGVFVYLHIRGITVDRRSICLSYPTNSIYTYEEKREEAIGAWI